MHDILSTINVPSQVDEHCKKKKKNTFKMADETND